MSLCISPKSSAYGFDLILYIFGRRRAGDTITFPFRPEIGNRIEKKIEILTGLKLNHEQ